MKGFVATGLMLAVLVTGSVIAFPKRAEAQIGCAAGSAAATAAAAAATAAATAAAAGSPGFPTKDIGNTIINKANLVASTKTAGEATVQSTVMCVLNGLAWTVAKTAIQSLTQSTVNWINSGFQGSPAFVTDLNRNMSMLADTVADDFLRDLEDTVSDVAGTRISVRSPFQDQIAVALREEFYRTTSSYGFDARNPYTLGSYSSDPEAFTRGDFRQGGLNSWFALSQRQQNNPWGRYQLAENELWHRVDTAAKNRIAELGWGKGFLPWRGNCGPNGNTASGSNSSSSKTTGSKTDSGAKNSSAGGAASGPTDLGGKNTNSVALKQKDATVGCAVRTPGAVIESALENQLGSGVRQLELADSINEIVGALVSQMVGKVLGGGGLLGVSQPSSGGGSSYLNRASDPAQYTGALSNVVSTGITNERQQVVAYQTAWQKIKVAGDNAKFACVNDPAKAGEADTMRQRASDNLARAAAALAAYDSIKKDISSVKDGGSEVVSAMTNYQSLFQRADIPSALEVEDALAQSKDTGTDEPGSFYSQMTRLAASCR